MVSEVRAWRGRRGTGGFESLQWALGHWVPLALDYLAGDLRLGILACVGVREAGGRGGLWTVGLHVKGLFAGSGLLSPGICSPLVRDSLAEKPPKRQSIIRSRNV